MKKKLRIIDGQVVIGTSGSVGLGQRFAGDLDAMWRGGTFSSTPKPGHPNLSLPHMAMIGIRETIWKHIEYETNVSRVIAGPSIAAFSDGP